MAFDDDDRYDDDLTQNDGYTGFDDDDDEKDNDSASARGGLKSQINPFSASRPAASSSDSSSRGSGGPFRGDDVRRDLGSSGGSSSSAGNRGSPFGSSGSGSSSSGNRPGGSGGSGSLIPAAVALHLRQIVPPALHGGGSSAPVQWFWFSGAGYSGSSPAVNVPSGSGSPYSSGGNGGAVVPRLIFQQ